MVGCIALLTPGSFHFLNPIEQRAPSRYESWSSFIASCLPSQKIEYRMYRDAINTADQALVHLAFHCCMKDGELQDEELDLIATSFVAKGVNKELDLKEEMKTYLSYFRKITDESTYLIFLIRAIDPTYRMALFAFCAEIVYRNNRVSFGEEILLNKLAGLLYVSETESTAVQRLINEMYQVEKANHF